MTSVEQLPEAVLEETIHPDDVILIPQEDGTFHLLLYTGKIQNGYISLKYVILDEHHVEGIAKAKSVDHDVVPRAPIVDLTQLPQPQFLFDDDVIRRA